MNITSTDDLRTAYLTVFDGFAVEALDLTIPKKVNLKYAREMLAILQSANLVVLTEEVNGEEVEAWQTLEINTDNSTHDEAVAYFDAWLASQNVETADAAPAKPAKAPKSKTLSPCKCGCGEQSANHYRPGHDARHAGQVGRKIAENYKVEGFDRRELLNDLPSEKLVAKAEAVAETAIKKIDAKMDREMAKAVAKEAKDAAKANHTEDGTVKVGKKEFAATRDTKTGEVVYYEGTEIKSASKTAAKTFTA